MAKSQTKKRVGSQLNQLHQQLQRQERENSYIIRLQAAVGHPLSKFTNRLKGRAKGKHREIAFQFEMLVEETFRIIPDPKAWGIFTDWVHHHRLVGALHGGVDIRGSEYQPPTDWLPDHPIVRAARKGNVRSSDGSKFFEPYPVSEDGIITIRRYDETNTVHRDDLQAYTQILEDVRNQLALELTMTKASNLRVKSASKFVAAATPYAHPNAIKRQRPDKLRWKNTTRLVELPEGSDLSKYRVMCITICEDGSMCHHLRRPEVSKGNQRVQRERTINCFPGLPEMVKQPTELLRWMDTAFAGLETAERPIFPMDMQGRYCAHMAYPLGSSIEILSAPGSSRQAKRKKVMKVRKISQPVADQLVPTDMEQAFAAAH